MSRSVRASEVIANPTATEGSQLSQEGAATESPLLNSVAAAAAAATTATAAATTVVAAAASTVTETATTVAEAAEDSSDQKQERETPVGASDALLNSDLYIAKYDFTGSTDLELALRKGDRVNLVEKADNGWWRGVCDGRAGWFPETYVRAAPLQERRGQRKVGVMEQGLLPRSMAEMMVPGASELEASGERERGERGGWGGDWLACIQMPRAHCTMYIELVVCVMYM